MHRRRFLSAVGVAGVGATAGCSGILGEASEGDGQPGTTDDGQPATTDGGGTEEPTIPGDVDGRYTGFQGGPRHLGRVEGGVDAPRQVGWSFSHDSEPPAHDVATPAIANGLVYAAETTRTDAGWTNYLTALDLQSGDVEWEKELPELQASSPVVTEGLVVQQLGRELVAFDAETGEQQWRSEVPIRTQPTVSDGHAYVVGGSGFSEGTLTAVDVASGDTRWSRTYTPGGSRSFVQPAVADGTVYTVEEGLVGRDAASGDRVWEASTERAVGRAPTIADETIYVATDGNRIAAIDRESGERQWSTEVADGSAGSGGAIVPTSPAVADGRVVASSLWAVTVLDAGSGERRWSKEGTPQGAPVFAEDGIYVAGLSDLVLYAPADGTEWDRLPTDNSAGSTRRSVAVVDGVVCYASDAVYAIGSAT